MIFLAWFSIATLLVLLGTYLYWSWREERARPDWLQYSFYGAILFFTGLLFLFTWQTLSVVPARTHTEALTLEVVHGKITWHKYVCIDCHTLLGNGAYYAPDLTKAWTRFVERAGGDEGAAKTSMMAFLKNPPQPTADRRGMFNFHMSDEEAEELTTFLRWISRIDNNDWPPKPMRPISAVAPPKPTGLSPLAAQGKALFAQRGCVACHSIGGGRVVGPDLIDAADKLDPQTLPRWIQNPEVIYHERGQKPLNPGFPPMPNLNISPQDAEALAAYLRSVAGKE